jgi:hypothetical protein
MAAMKMALARGWLPALISYSDDLPAEMGALSLAFIVVIRPKYRDDRGLREHQLEHVVQWYALLAATLFLALLGYAQGQAGVAAGLALASIGMHGLLYRRVRKFRLLSETQAFTRQMQFPDRHGNYLSLADAATRLASVRYDLGLTRGEAAEMIRGDGKAGSAAP